MMFKEQVNFTECTVFSLGEAKPAPNIAEKICAGVEETSFGSPVPSYLLVHALVMAHSSLRWINTLGVQTYQLGISFEA
jgi:hypothetical protein